MGKVPKDSIQKLTVFQQEVSKLFKYIFDASQKSSEKKVLDNVNFPVLVDLFETHDAVYIEVEVPGVIRDDLDVTISGNTLIVSGIKRDQKREGDRVNYYCMERDFGKFHRAIELPVTSDTKDINAVMKNGLLTIKLQRISERRGKKRRIEIQEIE